jgi:hypothetical protein
MSVFEMKTPALAAKAALGVFAAALAVFALASGLAGCSYPAGSAAEAEALSAPAGLVYARVALPAGGGVRPCFPVFSKQRHPL